MAWSRSSVAPRWPAGRPSRACDRASTCVGTRRDVSRGRHVIANAARAGAARTCPVAVPPFYDWIYLGCACRWRAPAPCRLEKKNDQHISHFWLQPSLVLIYIFTGPLTE